MAPIGLTVFYLFSRKALVDFGPFVNAKIEMTVLDYTERQVTGFELWAKGL